MPKNPQLPFFKQYYIIVDINGEKHGVITNKNIGADVDKSMTYT